MGVSRPVSIRTVVVFPAPLGPSSPNTSPGFTSKVSPSTAVRSPKRLARPTTSMPLTQSIVTSTNLLFSSVVVDGRDRPCRARRRRFKNPKAGVLDQRPLAAGLVGVTRRAGVVLDLLHRVARVERLAAPVHQERGDGLIRACAAVVAPEQIALRPVVRQVHPVAPVEPERERQRERPEAAEQHVFARSSAANAQQRPRRPRTRSPARLHVHRSDSASASGSRHRPR